MRVWDELERYGRAMTVCSKQRPEPRDMRAFLQPLRQEQYQDVRWSTAPGVFDKRVYLLVAPPEAFMEDETEIVVVCGGQTYELLRAELMTLGDEKTHWEGVLRPVGRVYEDA